MCSIPEHQLLHHHHHQLQNQSDYNNQTKSHYHCTIPGHHMSNPPTLAQQHHHHHHHQQSQFYGQDGGGGHHHYHQHHPHHHSNNVLTQHYHHNQTGQSSLMMMTTATNNASMMHNNPSSLCNDDPAFHHHHHYTNVNNNNDININNNTTTNKRCCQRCRCSNRLVTGIVITILPIAITTTLICVFMMQTTNLHQYAIYSFVIFCVAFVFPFALFFFTVILNKLYKFYKREILSNSPNNNNNINSLMQDSCDSGDSIITSSGYNLSCHGIGSIHHQNGLPQSINNLSMHNGTTAAVLSRAVIVTPAHHLDQQSQPQQPPPPQSPNDHDHHNHHHHHHHLHHHQQQQQQQQQLQPQPTQPQHHHNPTVHSSPGLICTYNTRAYHHPYYYQIQDGTMVALAPDQTLIIEDSPPSYEMALLCPSVAHSDSNDVPNSNPNHDHRQCHHPIQCSNALIDSGQMQVILPSREIQKLEKTTHAHTVLNHRSNLSDHNLCHDQEPRPTPESPQQPLPDDGHNQDNDQHDTISTKPAATQEKPETEDDDDDESNESSEKVSKEEEEETSNAQTTSQEESK